MVLLLAALWATRLASREGPDSIIQLVHLGFQPAEHIGDYSHVEGNFSRGNVAPVRMLSPVKLPVELVSGEPDHRGTSMRAGKG